jgi:hypothetical protein
MDSLLGSEYQTLRQARDAVQEIIISAGLSYKKYKASDTLYVLICKDKICITTYFIP